MKFLESWIKSRETNPPQEWRESVKLIIADFLASGLWGFLGWLAASHFKQDQYFANQYAIADSANKASLEQIDRAAEQLNSTAHSLYALLTPMATAVTGYFFVASSHQKAEKPSLPSQSETDPSH